ncbi:hypothetical protein ACFQ6U_36990 [Streptomyces sp. NPDC056465]|uniref:hypothetical protein n=1 Tax=Streptomyces sp. NPDC056465 TaxID=3345829 RepID=UPI0036736791
MGEQTARQLTEFFSACQLIEALQALLDGQGSPVADLDVEIALPEHMPTEAAGVTPVVVKGSAGKVWITAYNMDGELPPSVYEDLGISRERMAELEDIEYGG